MNFMKKEKVDYFTLTTNKGGKPCYKETVVEIDIEGREDREYKMCVYCIDEEQDYPRCLEYCPSAVFYREH